MFLKRLGLPEDITTASIRTRLNGEPLGWQTKFEQVGSGAWKLGIEVVKDGENYEWTTWTVENSTHVINFDCSISANGKLISGTVNIFALGHMPLDQDYVNELLEEYEGNPPVWEEIITSKKMEMDFTNPNTFLVQIKAKDDTRIFYCPRSAIKSFGLNQVNFNDVFETGVAAEDLNVFLRVFNNDISEEVKRLTVPQMQQLIRTAQACGISIEGHEFDSFGVLSDAIFSDGTIDWKVWSILANFYNLNMYKPDDAITLVGRRGQACWLDMLLREQGINPEKADSRELEIIGHQIMLKKYRKK